MVTKLELDLSYSKLQFEDGENFRLSVTIVPKFLELSLLHGPNAYKSTITKSSLATFAKHNQKTIEEYLIHLKTITKSPPESTYFTLNNDVFTIANKLPDSELKVKFFEHKLDKINYAECVELMLDTAHAQFATISSQFEAVQQHAGKVGTDFQKYADKLDELVSRKKIDEERLVGQFVLVLNEKKARIQHLNRLLGVGRRFEPKRAKIEAVSATDDSEEEGEEVKPITSALHVDLDIEFKRKSREAGESSAKRVVVVDKQKKNEMEEVQFEKEGNAGAVVQTNELNTQDLFSLL